MNLAEGRRLRAVLAAVRDDLVSGAMMPRDAWLLPIIQTIDREIAEAAEHDAQAVSQAYLGSAYSGSWQGRCATCGISGPGGQAESQATAWAAMHRLIGGDSRDAVRALVAIGAPII